jgi:hypothetical protein
MKSRAPLPPLRCTGVDVADEDDNADLAEACLLEALVGDHALGARIVRPERIEAPGHPGAEHAGRDEQACGGDHDESAPATHEAGKGIEHATGS